jgi:hypothetical protein
MTLCPICRAFPRFALRVKEFSQTPDSAEWEKLFTASCWVIAALERSRPCSAHPRTLRRARNLAEELVTLVEKASLVEGPEA